MTTSLPVSTELRLHRLAPTIFVLLLGQANGTFYAAASNRDAALLISPVAALQYMSLLVPMHSKPLSGQQTFAFEFAASVNVYLRGDKA